MRFNEKEIGNLIYKEFLFILFFVVLTSTVHAQVDNLVPRSPLDLQKLGESQENIPTQIDFKNIPDFPKRINPKASKLRILIQDESLPLDSRLKVMLDTPLSTKNSKVGDYFKAYVAEDFYLPTRPPTLLVPRGSWLRGRISFVKKPNILIMAGKLRINVDELVIPLGEVIPLNAIVDIQQGITNESGLLEPILLGEEGVSRANKLINKFFESKSISNNLVNEALVFKTLDFSVIGSLIDGEIIALISSLSEMNTLNKGQELQLVLRREVHIKF